MCRFMMGCLTPPCYRLFSSKNTWALVDMDYRQQNAFCTYCSTRWGVGAEQWFGLNESLAQTRTPNAVK